MTELAVVARFVLASVFLSAGVAKVPRTLEFIEAVRNYDLIPERLAIGIGRLLPVSEVLLGMMLFLGIALPEAGAVTGMALVAFSIVIAVNLLRGHEIACGCFGVVGEARLGWISILRNGVLIAAAGLTTWRPVATLSLEPAGLATGRSIPNGSGLAALVIGTLAPLTLALVRETRRAGRLLGARL